MPAKYIFLVYPKVSEAQQDLTGHFRNGEGFSCGLLFLELIGDNGKLAGNTATDLVEKIERMT